MAQYYNEESVDGAEKVQYHTGASVDGGEMAQYHMVGSANRADERTGSAWQKGQAGGVWKDDFKRACRRQRGWILLFLSLWNLG